MGAPALAGLNARRLRLWLGLFFLALAIPAGVLVWQGFQQLKWETFHQHQLLAEELAGRIVRRLAGLIDAEEARSLGDYAFLVVTGDPNVNVLQRSSLALFPVKSPWPGLLGYFQVDAQGHLSTPLVPPADEDPGRLGIAPDELSQRLALEGRIRAILGENRLVPVRDLARVPAAPAPIPPPAEAGRGAKLSAMERDRAGGAPASARIAGEDRVLEEASAVRNLARKDEAVVASQQAFDRLAEQESSLPRKLGEAKGQVLGRVEDLKLDASLQNQNQMERSLLQDKRQLGKSAPPREARKERTLVPEQLAADQQAKSKAAGAAQVRTFDSELEPFQLALLDSGQFVLYRNAWRDGRRLIQGALIEAQPFLKGLVEAEFRDDASAQTSDLAVAYRGNILATFQAQTYRDTLGPAESLQGSLLHQTRLSAPLSHLELIFSVRRLPPGPGGAVLGWAAAALALALCGGFYLFFRLALRQIDLVRQQQDFVSAVSHELKTPLTSIRLFSELLRQGWVTDEKRREYYDYIFQESERLSRLIANVLQLARLTRHGQQPNLRLQSLGEWMDDLRGKLQSQAEQAGFQLQWQCDPDALDQPLLADPDYLAQILINLVDNGLKFSAKAETRSLDLGCKRLQDGAMRISLRDYGPGVPPDQMKKIFRLFYRSETGLTRETTGTGIGLALVRHLAQAMGAKVEVVNRVPGAEFSLTFSAAESPKRRLPGGAKAE